MKHPEEGARCHFQPLLQATVIVVYAIPQHMLKAMAPLSVTPVTRSVKQPSLDMLSPTRLTKNFVGEKINGNDSHIEHPPF